jgi:formate dehydrogenase subunit gamma
MNFWTEVRRLVCVLAALCLLGFALPAQAQTKGSTSVNPTASSVKENELLEKEKRIFGRGTLPDTKSAVLEQPQGRDWRVFQQETLPRVGAIAILGMAVVLLLFLAVRGRIRISDGWSGREIVRFTGVERFGHWLTATSFIVLAFTGLNVTFGRAYILPLIGPEAFTNLSLWGKYIHNYVAFAFVVGLVMVFFMWVIHNFPTLTDVRWIAQGGGIVGGNHPPAAKFNAGQKLVFWATVLGGAALAITGFMLMFPFYHVPLPNGQFVPDIGAMQTVTIIHGLVAVIMVAVILAHIYIGTIGMEGAFQAMGRGTVDVNWAKDHHSIWFMKKAKSDPSVQQGTTVPAE